MKAADLSSSLSQKIYATFVGGDNSKLLPGLCLEMLSEQKKTWAGFAKAMNY